MTLTLTFVLGEILAGLDLQTWLPKVCESTHGGQIQLTPHRSLNRDLLVPHTYGYPYMRGVSWWLEVSAGLDSTDSSHAAQLPHARSPCFLALSVTSFFLFSLSVLFIPWCPVLTCLSRLLFLVNEPFIVIITYSAGDFNAAWGVRFN